MAQRWKAGDPCWRCDQQDREDLAALEARQEREEWSRRFGANTVILIPVTASRRVYRYEIPPHLRPKRSRSKRRRR